MLRIYRPLRTILASSRFAGRLPSGETVRIERVRVKRAKPVIRFFGNVIKGALVFQLLLWTIPPLVEPEGQSPQATEESEPLFIPFPGTTKARPREVYRPDSPEWQEFARISRDPRAQQAILKLAAKIVLDTAHRAPAIVEKMGPDFKIRRYWLDILYPFAAPIEYERSGLLITQGGIEWTTMPCDHRVVQNAERVLWPKPIALGSWAMCTEAVKWAGRAVARYFGFGSDDPSNPPVRPNPVLPPIASKPTPEVQKAIERIRQETTRRPEEVNNPGSMPSSSSAAPRDTGGPVADPNSKDFDPDKYVRTQLRKIANSPPVRRFHETINRNRPLRLVNPPRGSISVSGLVELETSRFYLVVEIITWYDPKTRSLVLPSTHMFVKRAYPRRMLPAQ